MACFESGPVVFTASVLPLQDPELYAEGFSALPAARQMQLLRLRDPMDRCRSLAASLLLQAALRQYGLPADSDWQRSGSGKPFLPGSGIRFNLSHSGDYALCALAGTEIGCDIERIRPVSPRAAERFFCPPEAADILAQPTLEARTERFFRYWTLKESFVKAVGTGLRLPMRSFCLAFSPSAQLVQGGPDGQYFFREFSDLPGYRCAVCTADDPREPVFHLLDLSQPR